MKNVKIEIYTKVGCGPCERAKALLKNKGVEYIEHDVGNDPVKREELVRISNGSKTVPQIFINDLHKGGCDDLYALDRSGKLDELLGTGS